MRQLAENIGSHVHQICCYGADNIGQAKDARDEYFKFLKAITVIFVTYKDLSLQKMGLSEKEQQAYNKLAQEIQVGKFKSQNAIFKAGETIAMVTIDEVINKVDLLRFVNKLYPLSQKFKFNKLQPKNFYALFALLLRDQEMTIAPPNQDEYIYMTKYELGIEFLDAKEKERFLTKTISDVKATAYLHGFGNCALMADTAFIQAIYLDHNEKITYLRFIREDGKADVLNCIVLGNWPEPNCIIISPWLAENQVISWQGSIEATPEIKGINEKYDSWKTLCVITPQEKAEAKKKVQQSGYKYWNEEIRNNNLAKVKSYADLFLENINQVVESTCQPKFI
jgi:hypothetical protein